MVEAVRGNNGKFVKRGEAKPNDVKSIAVTDDGTTAKDQPGDTVVNPAEIAGGGNAASNDDQPKRGRGRPRKDGGKAQGKTAQNLDLSALNALLFSTHMMLAALLKTPEFALEQQEADTLAKAASNVARHYDITASQKALDWGNLAFCMGATYAPRFYALKLRKREESKPVINGAATEGLFGQV